MAKLTKKKMEQLHRALEEESMGLLGIESSLRDQDETWSKFSFSDQRSRDSFEADPAVIERIVLTQLAEMNSSAADQVRRALQKMAEGTYGVCDVCGNPIALERLEARPRSVLCVACA